LKSIVLASISFESSSQIFLFLDFEQAPIKQ